MTYYNLIIQYGGEADPRAFVNRAAAAGVAGLIVPDLPFEESAPLQAACDAQGLDLVYIVAPTTTDERLDAVQERASGYVYVQARLGTTGAQADISDQTAESLARLSDWKVPKAVGFGISSGDQAERIVRAGADGVIVGSALVDRVAKGVRDGTSPGAVAQELKTAAEELKQGAIAGAEQTTRTGQ